MRKYKLAPIIQKIETKIVCNKCGKTYDCEKEELEVFMTDFIHKFKTSFGYASEFDGETWEFDLCEKCLKEFVDGFEIPIETFKMF
jgi:hypothetical protein